MTTYNRKMYRIDDIAFDKTPASTFKFGREKVEISYAQYYFNTYKHEVTDMNQPLLGSRPKKKEIHRGRTQTVYLIPEFCQMTGFTDEMRNNFSLMRELKGVTQQTPDAKFRAINDFMARIQSTEEIRNELTSWGLEFSPTTVQISGRIVPKEKVMFFISFFSIAN